MRCSECSNFMDKLNRCKFCHFEKDEYHNSRLTDKVLLSIREDIINEQDDLIKLLEYENKLLKQSLRELL